MGVATAELKIKYTTFFLGRARAKGRALSDFVPQLCRKMFARWGGEATGWVGTLLDNRLKTMRERILFTALGEVATSRYASLEALQRRGLNLEILASEAKQMASHGSLPKGQAELEGYLASEEFARIAWSITDGREQVEERSLDEGINRARKIFPGYRISGEAEIQELDNGSLLVVNASTATKEAIHQNFTTADIFQKGKDDIHGSIREYFERFGLNILIVNIEGQGNSYARLTMSGDLIICLAERDDPISALDDALVRIYFANESTIRSYVRRSDMPEMVEGWGWIDEYKAMIKAGTVGNLIPSLMSDHWVLNKTVLAELGKVLSQRLRGLWLAKFGGADLGTRDGIGVALGIVLQEHVAPEMREGGAGRWWLDQAQVELADIQIRTLVALRTEELQRSAPRPVIVTISPDLAESPPDGFDPNVPNSLVFDKAGKPFLVQWSLPALGEIHFKGEVLVPRVLVRSNPIMVGTTSIAPRRAMRPQDPIPEVDESISAKFSCDLCDPRKVAGPHTQYGRFTPEQWLEQGPFSARYLLGHEYLDMIGVYSGTNPFPFIQSHRMVLTDVHPRSHALLDFTPAMVMALYHGTHGVMRSILQNFGSEGIDQVFAGQNFGTAKKPFPSGATLDHPHAQVGANYTYTEHASNPLGRRVRRHNQRGIDFLKGYMEVHKQVGLVIYETEHVMVVAPFAPRFKDELQVIVKRADAGNPLALSAEEEGHVNFALAQSIFGLANLTAPDKDGQYIPTGIKSFNTVYLGRRTSEGEGNEGLRMIWTVIPRQSYIAMAEFQEQFVVDRDPVDTARFMRRTLNIMWLTALLEKGEKLTTDEITLLAEFATRQPGFERLYELQSAEQFATVKKTLFMEEI